MCMYIAHQTLGCLALRNWGSGRSIYYSFHTMYTHVYMYNSIKVYGVCDIVYFCREGRTAEKAMYMYFPSIKVYTCIGKERELKKQC